MRNLNKNKSIFTDDEVFRIDESTITELHESIEPNIEDLEAYDLMFPEIYEQLHTS